MPPIVMLPTYNEAENIGPVVSAILAADPRLHVLVVDDDSPDGTAGIVQGIARGEPRVQLLLRTERRGRGYAGAEGLRLCAAQGFDPIVEMDADFSHDPADLPRLLEAAERHDVVLGSRRVAGGAERGRGPLRRFITWGAGAYLKLLLGLWRVHDPTSGYRCFRRRTLMAIKPETLRSPGPGIVSEILFRCRRLDIAEVPIQFKDRERGRSKFGAKAMAESLALAVKLRLAALLGRVHAPRPEDLERGEGCEAEDAD